MCVSSLLESYSPLTSSSDDPHMGVLSPSRTLWTGHGVLCERHRDQCQHLRSFQGQSHRTQRHIDVCVCFTHHLWYFFKQRNKPEPPRGRYCACASRPHCWYNVVESDTFTIVMFLCLRPSLYPRPFRPLSFICITIHSRDIM